VSLNTLAGNAPRLELANNLKSHAIGEQGRTPPVARLLLLECLTEDTEQPTASHG
jgi:hypothetical protein